MADQALISSSDLEAPDNYGFNGSPDPGSSKKKILIIGLIALAVIVFIVIIIAIAFLFIKKPAKVPANQTNISTSTNQTVSPTSSPAILPNFEEPELNATTTATSSFSDLAIEYLSFADFYKKPDNSLKISLKDYELPLNVKIDVLNYYDVSRKLNLDPGLDSLNANGFALIDNPWVKEAPNFYGLYAKLNSQQLPLLLTADFITYYYQNTLKKVFKDVEQNVFFNNLWEINQELYQTAKNRYEAHLASIGDVNDSILEGERLETAFFAVSLQLLKPTVDQIAVQGSLGDKNQFTEADTDRFYFVVPPYLRADVLAEEKLIRATSKVKSKSPVLLYSRDYNDFNVPADYRSNAKLNNFYLTVKWLNSVFPVNYRDKNCPDCLLDKEDWRVNLTAASLMAQDFSSLPDIKNKWARIYKVISFFKGLREDLNYVNYRDSLVSLFGNNYDVSDIFGDQNKDALKNLEKLRSKLLTYNFAEISGGLATSTTVYKPRLGFKMMAESYSPNDYIFNNLTAPIVDTYLGTSTKAGNMTACSVGKVIRRCNGFSLDPVNLVSPIINNDYFSENTNYSNYGPAVAKIQTELNKANVWHLNNYWATLNLVRTYLEMPKSNLPLFARSSAWQNRALKTAAAIWVNPQLPLEKLLVNAPTGGGSLSNLAGSNNNAYIEPNISLIDELLSDNEMIIKMFNALQLDREVSSSVADLNGIGSNLSVLRQIISKELTGEKLTTNDNETISDFVSQFMVDASIISDKHISLKAPQQKTGWQEDLSRLKLMVLTHQEGDNKVFSVGPVWDYKESR